MGRFLGWALGIGCVLALSAAPAAAQVHVSVGVYGGGFGGHVAVGDPPYPVYAPVPVYYPPPVYAVPVYYPPVYYPAYRPVYRPAYRPVSTGRIWPAHYGPAYGGGVVVVQGRHDNGHHNGWYKNGKHGRGPQHGGRR